MINERPCSVRYAAHNYAVLLCSREFNRRDHDVEIGGTKRYLRNDAVPDTQTKFGVKMLCVLRWDESEVDNRYDG